MSHPKLSLRWNPRDDLMLYANASRGFRPPEMTELYRLQREPAVADLDSEQIDSVESGLKARMRRVSGSTSRRSTCARRT